MIFAQLPYGPVRIQTRGDIPIVVTSWMTPVAVKLANRYVLKANALDNAALIPSPEVDPEKVIRLYPPPPDWHARARCRQVEEPDIYFFGVDDLERPALPPKAVEIARLYCGECPVARLCLEHAMATPERYGIWGGTTGRDRAQMRRQVRQGDDVNVLIEAQLSGA